MSTTSRDSDVESLVEQLADEMRRRWQAGEQPLVEEFLARHPALERDPEAATELIYEEICLRQEHGEAVVAAEVLRRFPQWQSKLQILLDCHQLMEAGAAAPQFPDAGEVAGDFSLAMELGRGALGRVFLATQQALADRPVVLKMVPLLGHEHLSLARLQHTHIVPLYFVQDFPDRALRALCMPYFGGVTLAALLVRLHGVPAHQRTGGHIVDVLRQAQAAVPVALPVAGPGIQALTRFSYMDAVCWLGAYLADALQYAHERGLLHLDLKPANVLLAADGQPMLLDFHLARGPLAPGAPPPDWLGGTPTHMAPEQRAAWEAVRDGHAVPAALDGRADLYALGLVLYELLGGSVPPPTAAPGAELRWRNPAVTQGLADLLEKCLAADAQSRYPAAAALAHDLRRQVGALPLRGVPNRSWAERWRKWRRRRPHALVAYAVLAALLLLGVLLGGRVVQQHGQARAAQHEGREHEEQGDLERASAAYQRGLELAQAAPFSGGIAGELREQLHKVERGLAVRELHRFVDRARILADCDTLPAEEARTVERHCRTLWKQRERLTAGTDAGTQLDPQLREDLLDLAILWTNLRMRLGAPEDQAETHRAALEVLNDGERLCGPSGIVARQRAEHAAALGQTALAELAAKQAERLPPRTAWEYLALGRTQLRVHDFTQAAESFERALELRPGDLWANYHKGRCAFLSKQYEQAASAFTTCIALAPERGWCYYNRALAQAELGLLDAAARDLDRALQLDPALADAMLQRGLLQYRRQHYDAALADLARALALGASPAATHHGLALVYLARGDQAAAERELKEALRHDPKAKNARGLLDRLRHPG